MSLRLRLLSSSLAVSALAPAVAAQTIAIARSSARLGNVDVVIGQVQQVLATSPRSPEAHELLCELQLSIQQFDAALHECEAARDLQPGSSSYTLQLARAYGAKADHAGALTGMRMVGRIRDTFEHAAQLDPASVDALSDLGEFYVQAPGLVGGGLDRARAIANRLRPLSTARAHRLDGMIAAKSGDTAAATAAFAAELAASPSPEAYVDLATYAQQHKLWDDAAKNAALAIQTDTAHGPDTIDAAKILVDLKRELPAAITGLRAYLATPQTSAVKSSAQAHTLLGQALDATGDPAAARSEYQAALAQATNYEPARKALRR